MTRYRFKNTIKATHISYADMCRFLFPLQLTLVNEITTDQLKLFPLF